MIIVFTSNTRGGIIQFTVQLAKTFQKLGKECQIMAPEGALIETEMEHKTIRYKKVKTFSAKNRDFQETIKQLKTCEPELVFYTDSSIMSMRVLIHSGLEKRSVVVMHDVYPHVTRERLKTRLVNYTADRLAYSACKKCLEILLLSESCRNEYKKRYPNLAEKTLLMRLGAHVPSKGDCLPAELADIRDYYLFFGRIDQYKGIEMLLKAFQNYRKSDARKLVIAGAGEFSEHEKALLKELPEVILIHRFLDDGEIGPLYENTRAVVLPYIEASQSGVLPIAYHYGKPVIVSKLPGLVENVLDGETGMVVDSPETLAKAMLQMDDAQVYEQMQKAVERYYEAEFNWERNLGVVLEKLDRKGGR